MFWRKKKWNTQKIKVHIFANTTFRDVHVHNDKVVHYHSIIDLPHSVQRDCGNYCISSQEAGGLSLCVLIWGQFRSKERLAGHMLGETRPPLPLPRLRLSLCGTLLEQLSLLDNQMANEAYGHCVGLSKKGEALLAS